MHSSFECILIVNKSCTIEASLETIKLNTYKVAIRSNNKEVNNFFHNYEARLDVFQLATFNILGVDI